MSSAVVAMVTKRRARPRIKERDLCIAVCWQHSNWPQASRGFSATTRPFVRCCIIEPLARTMQVPCSEWQIVNDITSALSVPTAQSLTSLTLYVNWCKGHVLFRPDLRYSMSRKISSFGASMSSSPFSSPSNSSPIRSVGHCTVLHWPVLRFRRL